MLRLRVTEGRIAEVKLDGDIGPAGKQVLRFLNRLTDKANQPINVAALERYLLLAQDVPGVTLRAVVEPSGDEPGAMNLIAQVSRKPVSGSASFDNRAFDQTGPVEGLLVLDLNSFSEFGERTEFTFYHTFPNSQNFGQASTEFFIGSSGLRLKVYGGRGSVNPDGVLGQGGYQGTTTVFGTQVTYPLIRSRQQTLNLFGILDADPNIDAVAMEMASGFLARAWAANPASLDGLLDTLAAHRDASPKPFVAVLQPQHVEDVVRQARLRVQERGIAAFASFDRAARALARAIDYHRFRAGLD